MLPEPSRRALRLWIETRIVWWRRLWQRRVPEPVRRSITETFLTHNRLPALPEDSPVQPHVPPRHEFEVGPAPRHDSSAEALLAGRLEKQAADRLAQEPTRQQRIGAKALGGDPEGGGQTPTAQMHDGGDR